MHRIATAITCLFVAGSLAAQDVSFWAKVEDGENVCYYCPGYDYVIDDTHTKLKSSTINLAPFVGQYVKGKGSWSGTLALPTITVTEMSVVSEGFSIGGGANLGGEAKFIAHGTPGQTAAILLAASDGFVPAGQNGILFLNPTNLLILGQGLVEDDGEFSIEVSIPNVPALNGLAVFGQAVFTPAAGMPRFSNLDRKVIGPAV
jgi:hypothetical protein